MSTGYVCPECGLDYETISPPDAKVALRSYPRRYRAALAAALDEEAGDALIRRRPAPEVWSALEYTAHVADVLDGMAEVLTRMYAESRPALELEDPDELAATRRYNEQDPAEVLTRLEAAAARTADAVERIDADSWHRTGVFSWGERDLLTMTRNAVHEGSHHLRDLERSLEGARRARG